MPPDSWFLHDWLEGRRPGEPDELRRRFCTRTPTGDAVKLVRAAEATVQRDPHAFTFAADGTAGVEVQGRKYSAGRFETPTIAELKARLRNSQRPPSRPRLFVLHGVDAFTDIGLLQGTAPAGVLFQVASQFNCLEAPGPALVPVANYPSDPTQGPRAAFSAFPGALLRHYATPGPNGDRFTQSAATQLNLLRDAIPEDIARVEQGYLTSDTIRDDQALGEVLEQNFDQIRIGVHTEIDVVFGHDWSGPVTGSGRTTQALTSTLALAYGTRREALRPAAVQLLRAAYLGTLLAALDRRLHTVVLTLIGGGAFGNPPADIWAALLWAFDQIAHLSGSSLDVILNARDLAATKLDLDSATRQRHGRVIPVVA